MANGILTLQDVDQSSALLTANDQLTFLRAITTQGDRGVNQAKTNIRQALQYDANSIRNMSPEDAARISNEVNNVNRQLDDEIERRKVEQNPMNEREIIEYANELISQAPGIRQILNEQYDYAVEDATVSRAFPNLIAEVSEFPIEKRPAEIIKRLDIIVSQEDVSELTKNASKSLRIQMIDLKKRYEALVR